MSKRDPHPLAKAIRQSRRLSSADPSTFNPYDLYERDDWDAATMGQVVAQIVRIHSWIEREWKNIKGWGPESAATLLADSRLDWLASLARSLPLWVDKKAPPAGAGDGHLILAWVTLGALVEGTMKFFLSVYAEDYRSNVEANTESVYKTLVDKKGRLKQPDGLELEVLRQFFHKQIWHESERAEWDMWISFVRDRRNAIHAYKDRPIDTRARFRKEVRTYLRFLLRIVRQLPEPHP